MSFKQRFDAAMTNIVRSVRKLMPHGSDGDDEVSVGTHRPNEFRPVEKAKSILNRARSLSRHSDIDTEYVEAPDTNRNNNKALSPTSASSANADYQLMDHPQPHPNDAQQEHDDERQGPPLTDRERIQQSFYRAQRRVSDSWKTLQDASKRLVTRSVSSSGPADAFLLQQQQQEQEHPRVAHHGYDAHRAGESRQDDDVLHDHRLLRKAMRNVKNSLGGGGGSSKHLPAMDAVDSTVPGAHGYVGHHDTQRVVFMPRDDMVAA